jgi:FkbM family methyltransferase
LTFANASSDMVQRTFWRGIDDGRVSAEGAQIELWESLCRDATEIVEVGANIGLLTVPGGKATAAPYRAVEPHPITASVLRRNLELNGLNHVSVVEAAAMPDATRGTVELVEPASDPFETSGAAAVAEAGGHRFPGRARRVQAVPIQDLAGSADLIKLDVEGMELPLLGALKPLLLRRRPTMMIEVLDGNVTLREWLAQFADEHDWQILAVTADGPRLVEASALPTTRLVYRYGTRDVLLLPRERPLSL